MKVVFSPRARRNLQNIEAYLEARNPYAAVRSVDRIVGTAELFAEFPFLGRDYDGRNRVFAVPRTRYRVFYWIREDQGLVEVLTLAHSCLMPSSFKG